MSVHCTASNVHSQEQSAHWTADITTWQVALSPATSCNQLAHGVMQVNRCPDYYVAMWSNSKENNRFCDH